MKRTSGTQSPSPSVPKSELESALNALMAENKPNLGYPSDKYACGYHDALVDVMKRMGIETEEKYYD